MTLTVHAGHDEETRIADVRSRLAQRFPDLDPALVVSAVDEAHRGLAGATVRDFVPILVEKHARDVLEQARRH
jgi:hypothetical protein